MRREFVAHSPLVVALKRMKWFWIDELLQFELGVVLLIEQEFVLVFLWSSAGAALPDCTRGGLLCAAIDSHANLSSSSVLRAA